MPKLKTRKGAGKRFKSTKSGKFKYNRAYGRHILTKKSPKRRRNLRKPGIVSSADQKRIERMLPYGAR